MRYQFLTFLIHSFLPPRAAPWPARRRVSTRQASTLTSPLGLAQACTLVPSRTCTDRHQRNCSLYEQGACETHTPTRDT